MNTRKVWNLDNTWSQEGGRKKKGKGGGGRNQAQEHQKSEEEEGRQERWRDRPGALRAWREFKNSEKKTKKGGGGERISLLSLRKEKGA